MAGILTVNGKIPTLNGKPLKAPAYSTGPTVEIFCTDKIANQILCDTWSPRTIAVEELAQEQEVL